MTGPPRPASGILTLTTDFGLGGPYVAAMKGVVLGLAPGATLVDLSHSIAPQDVAAGAFVLAEAFSSFPEGTVHLAVIDPGVGTGRRSVAVEARGHWFVLPDNGLVAEVLRGGEPTSVREIRNPGLWRSPVSATFHGRDIFAPVAAHLVLGRDPAEIGPAIDSLASTMPAGPTVDGEGLIGSVIFVDPFGNLITNLQAKGGWGEPGSWTIRLLGKTVESTRTYGDRPAGSLVALVGSSGRVEVAEVGGSAAGRLGAGRGTPVRLATRGVAR